jgi:hypothetical protein
MFQKADAQGNLIHCEFFDIRRGLLDQAHLGITGEHLAIALIRGQLTAAGKMLRAGDFALVPACLSESQREITSLSTDAEWIEIRVGPA